MTYEDFRAAYHLSLNAQQEAAVRQGGGPVLLLAVPGSGKTTVIVARLGYLIHCMGVDPSRILTVTYTVAATADMRRRYAAVFGVEERLTFKTINALCAAIIRRYAAVYGRTPFQLLSAPGAVERILRACYTAQGWGYPSDAELKEAQTKIAYCKNMCSTQAEIGAMELEGASFPTLYQAYCDTMRRRRLMDFDDQMVIALQILRKYPDLLAEFQNRWQYLHVDEAQDTSKIQHILLQLLAAGHRNLFLVGDEDQSIYGFRAAYPQALLDFDTRYPDADILLMETNYRSTQAIVDRASRLIARNTSRHPKQMRAVRPGGEAVRQRVLGDYREQYPYLAGLAKAARQSTEQTAVLYRNNDSALPLIDLLARQGIPYHCRQRDSLFFSHPIVQDLTGILRFAFTPEDRAAFLKFYYKLGLRIKKETLSKLLPALPPGPILKNLASCQQLEPWQAAKAEQLQRILTQIPRLTSLEALTQILYGMGYLNDLRDRGGDTSKADILLALADQHPDSTEFLDRLTALEILVQQGGGESSFILSTIHASKGLEYDRVVLIDVIDGLFPAVQLSNGVYGLENRDVLEEERRLFYVGVTRAKSQLEILAYQTRFGVPIPGASFLRELLEEPEPSDRTRARKRFLGKRTPQLAAYKPGVRVVHKSFGPGAVNSRQGGIVTLALDQGGVKRVDLAACLNKNLLWLEKT